MASIKGILDQIGNTPLVEASHLISKKGVKLYLKLVYGMMVKYSEI